jgi:hypothetical protein
MNVKQKNIMRADIPRTIENLHAIILLKFFHDSDTDAPSLLAGFNSYFTAQGRFHKTWWANS